VYLQNKQIPIISPPGGIVAGGTPRGKDQFILISAGADRYYGTLDDQIYP
jgi:hypothetical protein